MQRSALESRVRQILPWLWLAWLILTALGGLFLAIRGNLLITFAGLFAVLVGAALITPPLTAVFMRLVAPLSSTLFGVLGRMAPRELVGAETVLQEGDHLRVAGRVKDLKQVVLYLGQEIEEDPELNQRLEVFKDFLENQQDEDV